MRVSEPVAFAAEYRLFVLDARVHTGEANMAWFAQPYWSERDRVLDVVMRAAAPAHPVAPRDQRFVRPI